MALDPSSCSSNRFISECCFIKAGSELSAVMQPCMTIVNLVRGPRIVLECPPEPSHSPLTTGNT